MAAIWAAPALASNPGDWTQHDIDSAISSGVDYLISQQDLTGTPATNPNYGRIGSSYPVSETSMAIISIGVLDLGHFANLSAARKTAVKAAINWLLKQQDLTGDTSTNPNHGSWNVGLQNYDTALAITALSFSGDVPADPSLQSIATAKQKGRAWEIAHQTWFSACDPPVAANPSQGYCGGFTYDGNPGSSNSDSDASNTGFSMTGIELTGGVPQLVAQRNLFWQRHTQEIATNPLRHGTDNDGCGSYQPGFGSPGSFAYSNANDTGTLLFGFGYDGLNGNDAGVKAALACGNNMLSAYVMSKDKRSMIAHHNDTLDPPCHVDSPGCNYVTDGDGGYHYSMFSLSKGIGQFTAASLTNPNNYYAKIVDLLLSQQDTSNTATKGSWPTDPRDDPTTIMSTGFSILALGRVGQPATLSGVVYNDKNGNGHRNAGEPGQGGVTVYLDSNDNAKLDSGERRAVSGSNGSYTIQDIQPKTYPALREIRPAGFSCTQPKPCRYRSVSLVSGQTATGKDFGNHKVSGACTDNRTPTSSIKHLRRFNQGEDGITVSGKSRDRGPQGCSGLKRVKIALAQLDGRRCRFVTSTTEFSTTRERSCRRRFFITAHGKGNWSLSFDVDLFHGTYRLYVRAGDRSGNKKTISRTFTVG